MNTKFTLKNFRCFDSKGVTIDLKPITLLTGCNSSGKSSIVKALHLLSDYFQELKNDQKYGKPLLLTNHKLDFTKSPHNLLGDFSRVINKKAEDRIVTMSLECIGKKYELELKFEESNTGILKNGNFKNIKINELDDDDTLLYNNSNVNFNVFLQKFLQKKEIELEVVEGMPIEGGWVNAIKVYKKLIETGILFYFPILESKLGGSKTESIDFLNQTLKDELISKTDAVKDIKTLIDDFSNSDASNFISWYKKKEKEYWEKLSNKKVTLEFFDTELNANNHYYKLERVFKDEEGNVLTEKFKKRRFFVPNRTKEEGSIKDCNVDNSKSEECLTFREIVEIIDLLSYMYEEENDTYQTLYPPEFSLLNRLWGVTSPIDSIAEEEFLEWIKKNCLTDIICNQTPNALQYVSSSVANIKRLYSLSDEDEFSQLLKRYIFNAEEIGDSYIDLYKPGMFMDKWVREFGIGQRISIEPMKGGLVELRLHKTEEDLEGTLLADNGYGLTQLFAIMLNIEVAIMESKLSKGNDKTSDSVRTIAIEEPEIHLHPSYQSKLADMFYEAYNDYGIHFIVETHSEYLIRKTQVMVAEKNYETKEELEEKCPFTTYYVPDQSTGRVPYSMEYRRDGRFKKRFDSGFYDEASNLVDEII